MPPWHRSGDRVTAEALWQLCEGLARELAWTGRVCRQPSGRMLCFIRVCGSHGRPRMRERPREAMHGDVMCVVGRCGALEQRIAAACDLPVRRVHAKSGGGPIRTRFLTFLALGRAQVCSNHISEV